MSLFDYFRHWLSDESYLRDLSEISHDPCIAIDNLLLHIQT